MQGSDRFKPSGPTGSSKRLSPTKAVKHITSSDQTHTLLASGSLFREKIVRVVRKTTTRHTAKNSGLLPRNLRVSSRISGCCRKMVSVQRKIAVSSGFAQTNKGHSMKKQWTLSACL